MFQYILKKINIILIISILANGFLAYNYFSDNCKSIISGLNQELQNALAENSKLVKNNFDVNEKLVKFNSSVKELTFENEDLKNSIKNRDVKIANSQKLVINLKNQLVNSWIEKDSLVAENKTNVLTIPVDFNEGNIYFFGELGLNFDQGLSVEVVKRHYLGMQVNAVLKQDPFQIITTLVREGNVIKSFIKLNRIHDGKVIKSSDSIESSDTIVNPDVFSCPSCDRRLTLGFGYSPVAGLLRLGFSKWGIGVINTFDNNQQSYIVTYDVDVKDLFSSNVTDLIF